MTPTRWVSDRARLRSPAPGRPARRLRPAILGLALLLTTSWIHADPAESPAAPASSVVPLPEGVAPAARGHDWERVRELLEPLASRTSPLGAAYRTLLGLHAHGAERIEEARVWLDRPPGEPTGPLDDWALWALSDSLAALGEEAGAQEALEALLTNHPESILRDRARIRSAELAERTGDLATGWRRVAEGRLQPLRGEAGSRLERVAWSLALREGRPEAILDTARRLAVHHPTTAAELDVARFADPLATGWDTILTHEELVARARNLRAAGELEAAAAAVGSVPPGSRDEAWALETAEIRLARSDGRGALEALDAVGATSEDPRLAWAMARASLDAARARSRDPLTSRQRETLRVGGLHWLDRTARLAGEDRALALSALTLLFEELAAGERIDEAIAVRERILALDPESEVGRAFLWNRGWSELSSRNPTGAIGHFTILARDPRQDRTARGARYWTARSWETLGDRERARSIYRELASSPVVDFYHLHAAARLDAPARPGDDPAAPGTWPRDEGLDRASFLSDAGLDHLAEFEIEALAGETDPRAVNALRGLVLARRGEVRESMTPLYRAFPAVATAEQGSVPLVVRRLYYPAVHPLVVERWAAARGLPSSLVYAVIRQESAFDARATSRAGARGLMQLMRPTARELAGRLGLPFADDRLYEPDYNLQLGTRYLAQVLEMFDGNVQLALAGYNGGPYRIQRWWRESGGRVELDRFVDGLALSESRVYVHRVLLLADSYARLYGLDPVAPIRTASLYTTEPRPGTLGP